MRLHVEALGHEAAVGRLGGIRNLVEVLRLERDEIALLGECIGGGRLGMRKHVDGDSTGVHLLLEAAENGGTAGAEKLDFDAGLLPEQRDNPL